VLFAFASNLQGCGYKVKLDVSFVPISGLTGANVKDRMYKGEDPCPWYKGKTLLGQVRKVA
jgi:peptide chain release factor subunit 3